MKRPNLYLALLLVGILWVSSCQFQKPGENADLLRVTGNIVCDCGCPPTLVRACSCTRAEEMTEEVRGLMQQGKKDDDIYAAFVAKYGTQILAAPKATGFNLLGWIFPFLAALSGGAIVAAVYHSLKQKKISSQESGDKPNLEPADTDKYREMLARELAE